MDRVLNKINSVTKDTTNQVKKISNKVNALSELTKGVLGSGAATRHNAEMAAAAAAARKVAANAAANAANAQRLAAEALAKAGDKNTAGAKAAANAAKAAEEAAKSAKEAEAAANEANQNRKRAALFENSAQNASASASASAAASAAANANEANQNRKRAALFENTDEEKAAKAAANAANEANQNRKRAALFEDNTSSNSNLSKVNTTLFNNDSKNKSNNSNLSKVNTTLFQNTPSVASRLAIENVKENAPQLRLTVPQQTRLRSYAEDMYRIIRANPSAQIFITRAFEDIRRNELTSEQIRRILSNLRAIAREDSRDLLTDRNQPLDTVLNVVTENASANTASIGPPTPTTDQRATLRNMVSRFFNIGMDVVNDLSDVDLFNALLLYHFLSMGHGSGSGSGSRSASASGPALGNRAYELENGAPPSRLALQDGNANRGLRIRTPPNADNLYVSPASTGSLSLSNYNNDENLTLDTTPTPKASGRLNPGSSTNMVRYAKGGRRTRKMKSSRRMSCGCGVKFGGARKTRMRKNKNRKTKKSSRR